MTRPARALIDYQALRHNLQQARQAAPGRKVVAVVKANAYGHGLVKVAQALSDADAFAVARLNEGLQLRQAGIETPVVLLSGVESLEDLRAARTHRLDLVVHSEHQIRMLEDAPSGPRVRVWLKMDSGMHRLGIAPQSIRPSYARLTRCGSSVGGQRSQATLGSQRQRIDAQEDAVVAMGNAWSSSKGVWSCWAALIFLSRFSLR